MNESQSTVLIIGGGLIGLASAYYLQKSGFQVTVLDKGRIGGACSHGNCGLISPSHVLPLAEPGTIRYALTAAIKRDPALRVRLRFDWKLWKWLWKFAKRCNHTDMLDSAAAINALLKSSKSLYQQIVDDEGLDCEWQRQGLYFVYKSENKLKSYEPTNELLTSQFDEPAELVGQRELIQREPALAKDMAGAWYFETDCHLRPDRLVAAWHKLLLVRGVKFVEECEVERIQIADGQVKTVATNQGAFTAEAFLVALGSWTPLLTEQLGVEVPIQPGKGYSMTMQNCPVRIQTPMIFPEHRVAVTPFQTGLRLGSMMEFAGYDSTIDQKRLSHLTKTASLYFQDWAAGTVDETWYGWRPMIYDSVPVIDRVPQVSNVLIAAGHNMLGLSMAPATGRLVSELMAGTAPHVPSRPYSLQRFAA